MKKAILVSIIVVIALATSVWFYGYYNHKNNDNLPSLSSVAKIFHPTASPSVNRRRCP